jgi:hypothetical protein
MKNIAIVSFVLAANAGALAATLSMVPMQGGMVMPMISHRAAENRLEVMLEPTVPRLTPLLASNPGDSFDPADPWFALLDPSGQGWSFSRRYGFVMGAMTDPLPPGRQIWIRKVAGDPGLLAFRYASSAPKAFEPIFGTAGSSAAMRWNGMMFHPVFAAAPGTNELTARFEAFLADAETGAEVPGSGTGEFTLTWTNLPEMRPALSVEVPEPGRVTLSWAAGAAGYELQSADAAGGAWSGVSEPGTADGDRRSVTLESAGAARLFRLRSAP